MGGERGDEADNREAHTRAAMTRLCVPLFVTDTAQAQRDIALAGEAGADVVELRIDEFIDLVAIRELLRTVSLPCLLTCRPEWEGGRSTYSNEDRILILQGLAGATNAAYIDLELTTAVDDGPINATHTAGGRVILSSHDFTGRPARLTNIFEELS